jgi:hypothetical protein
MTSDEAVLALKARGLYVVAGDQGSFRGGTSREFSGNIAFVQHGFFVGPREGKWIVTHGLGQKTIDHVCDSVEEAFAKVTEYIDSVQPPADR